MSPEVDVRVTVPDVSVTAPDLVMVPEPWALTFIVPLAPVEALALIAIAELLPLVESETVAVPLIDIAAPTVKDPLELTVTGLVVPEIAPSVVVLEAPVVVTLRDRAPRVIVCPADVKTPPLLNCRL